ncbi:glycosyltransferase [Xanthomonas campestris pv. campestris]|uniref:glycosyltransferase n=1 Tax=Xanthomonas campestris TaxID=339 RepID=UPI00226A9726|nr:glycosyltransferase [Xanthomonas campestris]MDO0788040.1 glycosyltransferase [Xanthomonas campestris pv. campestris]MDO0837445.1 glycosyltransferase [Xanthomonas campestris pv. campestris]MEB1347685.1 glycosyltransferase [Xanthomonas campestris pv. campestris]WDJ95489.1 glycosyltransferase [Xanthomonas campestris pv. incanae]WDK51212.1 glycosyltransferase [Xanthomonas campestris pv. campestris]
MSVLERPSGRARWPLVSVLIPAFNHARFVQRCLDSVLEDPYPSKEIVIIDDGSSDDTGEQIAAWIALHGHRVPVQFVQRSNRGVAATLNELALRARGEYLRICASDDYLLPGGLHVQVDYLVRHRNKAAVIGDAIVIDGDGATLHASAMSGLHGVSRGPYASDDGIRREIICRWAVSGAVLLLRRSTFAAGLRWNESLRIEDWDFYLRLVSKDLLAFIDVPVCAYRLHGANASKTRDPGKRLSNLTEFLEVASASRHIFGRRDQRFILAQSSLISSKIHFIEKRYLQASGFLVLYLTRSVLAKAGWDRMVSS